ncbi:MAG TPA: GNVR domain-containing protein [Devosia sp.]|nr:GNVR domain-containing protein [Devosia sp.]
MNDSDFLPRDLFGLLRRQFRLILAILIVVLGAATGIIFLIEPTYTAQSLVMVDTSHKDLLDPNAQVLPSQDSPRIDSEVELVRSETTLQRVLKDAHLLDNPEFALEPSLLDNLLFTLRMKEKVEPTPEDLVQAAFEKLVDMISVQRKGTTYLIAITARSKKPETAAMLANAVAQAYIEEQLASKINSVLAASSTIQARVAEANRAVVNSEEAFDKFIGDNLERIAATTGRTDLIEMRRELDASIAAGSSLSTQVQQGNESAANRDWQSVASTLRDEAIAKLAADRKRVADNLAAAASGDTASLREQLSQIEAQLETRTTARLETLRSELSSTQATASQLRQDLRTSVLGADLPAETLASIYEVQQNAELARAQYQALLARSKDLETQAYLQVADSRVVSSALTPTAPSSPNKRLILGIAGILGLLGGVGIALVYETMIGGFTSADQLRNQTRLAVPTSIPREAEIRPSDREGGPLTLADHLVADPLSSYSESIRRLRVGLDQSARRARAARGDTEGNTVIMVTSSAAGEGKTTTALALARAYALSGSTTLLVDCDLRKPSLHRQLGLEPSSGLLDYLAGAGGEHSLRSIVTTDETSGVQVVVGARQSEVATDRFVTGPAFTKLVEAARRAFDVVILDTPPIGPVVDGLFIAATADVIAVVVRYASTSQREVKSALLALEDSKQPSTEILAVLNQVDERMADYRGKDRAYYARA